MKLLKTLINYMMALYNVIFLNKNKKYAALLSFYNKNKQNRFNYQYEL